MRFLFRCQTTIGPENGFLGGQSFSLKTHSIANLQVNRWPPKGKKRANSRTRACLITHAAATWNNGLDGSSGKEDGMGGAVGVDAGISIRATGIGWRRIGILFETTRRT